MSPIHYCPLCSAYLSDGGLSNCPKCGADLESEKEKKEKQYELIKRRSETVQGPFHPVTGRKCPVCQEDVEILSPKVEETTVYGKNCGKGPMGEMRAPTQVFIGIQEWRCRRFHKLFSSYEVETRKICPKCLSPVNQYGKLVMSCPKCSTMIPVDYYEEGDPLEILSKRNYTYAPELE
jgi:phage FluMu protein Com